MNYNFSLVVIEKKLKYPREILFILGKDRTGSLDAVLFWASSLLDLAGLSLVTPYIDLLLVRHRCKEERLEFD